MFAAASIWSYLVSADSKSIEAGKGGGVVGAGDTSKDVVTMSLRKKEPIPVVDLSQSESEIVSSLRAACIYPGFFHLTGLPEGTLEGAASALAMSRKFFALPENEKAKLANSPALQFMVTDENGIRHAVPGSGNGYRAPGKDHHFNIDARESFNIGREPLKPDEVDTPPYANAWPDESLLPGFKATVLAHQANMASISARMRRLTALALGAPADFFEAPGLFDKPTYQTGFVRYLPEKSRPEDSTKPRFGIKPHTDGGLITLLYTDGQRGLHICPDKTPAPVDRVWIPVDHRTDALIVNLGSDLERWSNGLFPATLHCVISEGHERYSLPFFYETNIDAKVVPFCKKGEERYEVSSPQDNFLLGLRTNKRIR